ncbi:MAG TPA: GumC family protein [Candidatus Acidoferrum sp.]|nr:GumC family protein [Candidatus Acidoferrum sp.]
MAASQTNGHGGNGYGYHPESLPELENRAFRDYRNVLVKHWWLVTAVFLITVVTVAIRVFSQVPIYQASATVLIDPEPPRVLNIQDVAPMGAAGVDYQGSQSYYPTQYEILKSRPVMERAAEALKTAGRNPGGALRSGLSIEPKRNTRLVYVRYEHPDPSMAAEIANGIAQSYVRYNLDLKLQGARDAMVWLTNEMQGLEKKVKDSAMALQNYRVKSGMVGVQEQRQIGAQKLMDANKSYVDAQAQRLSLESKLRTLTAIGKDRSGEITLANIADTPLIQKVKGEISELESQRAKLLKTYKDKHPEVLKVDAQLQQAHQKVEAEIQTVLRAVSAENKVAKAREDSLLAHVNDLRNESQRGSEKEIQFIVLQREFDTNQQLYEAVLKRFKETGVSGGIETNNVRVIEPAIAPRSPIRPNTTFALTVSVCAGLLLGMGVAFTVGYFDRTMKGPDEVERYLGLPVVGIIPSYSEKGS